MATANRLNGIIFSLVNSSIKHFQYINFYYFLGGLFMLTFEQKKIIIEQNFPTLVANKVSMGRVNYQFQESTSDKINAIYHLHPNGNGFVYVGKSSNYIVNDKGFVNIREFSETEIITAIQYSLTLLSATDSVTPALKENWQNKNNIILSIIEDQENELFFVYTDTDVLDAVFNTYPEACDYLSQEGFVPCK